MKTKWMIIAMLSVVTMVATAQTYRSLRDDAAIQSQQIMGGSAIYQGRVYEPFSNETPSEQSYSPAKAPSGPRRGFDTGAETGKSNESPIGDAVLPMMVMAMLFAGVIAIRRKRTIG